MAIWRGVSFAPSGHPRKRSETPPVFLSHSCEAVSDQEFERTVEADVGEARSLELGRTKADEFEHAFEAARECKGGIVRKIARKDRGFASAIEYVIADCLALFRNADDAGKLLLRLFHRGFAGCADRGEGGDIDLGAEELGTSRGIGNDQPQNVFEPVVASVVEE